MKQTNIKKEVLSGVLIGLISTAIGFYFYTQVFNQFSMKFVKKLILEEGYLGDILVCDGQIVDSKSLIKN